MDMTQFQWVFCCRFFFKYILFHLCTAQAFLYACEP